MLKRNLVCVLLGLWIGGTLWGEGTVSSPKRRDVLLEIIEEVISAEPTSYPPLPEERKSPFSEWRRKEEVVTRNAIDSAAESAPQEVEAPKRLEDEVALAVIGSNFNASGSFITSSRRMIRLKNGTLVSEGSSFSARIGEETYMVIVSKVDSDSYVLTLGNASVTRSFGASDLKNGSINRGGNL